MDIYLTGHLALAFGIFAQKSTNLPINRSFKSNQINQFIHLYNPSFFLVLGLKQKPPQKNLRDFPALSFCPSCP